MRKFRNILLSLALAFVFVITLASCSKVSKSYADKINEGFKNGNCLTYQEVKDELGDECIDATHNNANSGLLIAVKGVTRDNYREMLAKADSTTKYEVLAITVVQGQCQNANYASGTLAEALAGIDSLI